MEQFANEAGAKLDGSITSSAVSVLVKTPVNVPASGTFRARVGTEYLKVTAVSSLTWTVVRGDGGTTAASHADSADVTVIVTKEAIDAIVSVQQDGTAVANRRVLNFSGATVTDDPTNGRVNVSAAFPFESPLAAPDDSTFTWMNQGSASVSSPSYGGVLMHDPAHSGDQNRIRYIATPATPYHVTARIRPLAFGLDFLTHGMTWVESSSGKLHRAGHSTNVYTVSRWTNASTFSSNDVTNTAVLSLAGNCWWRLSDDGTNRKAELSNDGLNWITLWSGSRTTYITPDRLGWFVNANFSTQDMYGLLQSWQVT